MTKCSHKKQAKVVSNSHHSIIFSQVQLSFFVSSNSKKLYPAFENSVEDVFVDVEPILRSALDGHNVCILAYGQTGTGKTFTMVSN